MEEIKRWKGKKTLSSYYIMVVQSHECYQYFCNYPFLIDQQSLEV